MKLQTNLIAALVFGASFFTVSSALSATTPKVPPKESIAQQFTNGQYNGRFVMEAPKTVLQTYILGFLEGVSLSPGSINIIRGHYPNYRLEDIADSVKKYYENNPSKRDRAVNEVILAGCK